MPCPECGAKASVTNGERWKCLSCGETHPALVRFDPAALDDVDADDEPETIELEFGEDRR